MCYTKGRSSLTKVPDPSPKSLKQQLLLSRLYLMTMCLLPMPASIFEITQSFNGSPFYPYSQEPITVHPSLLALNDPMRPHAFIVRTVLFGIASPSTTYIWRRRVIYKQVDIYVIGKLPLFSNMGLSLFLQEALLFRQRVHPRSANYTIGRNLDYMEN